MFGRAGRVLGLLTETNWVLSRLRGGLAVPYADYKLLRSCSTVQVYPRTVLLYEERSRGAVSLSKLLQYRRGSDVMWRRVQKARGSIQVA